MALAQRIGRSRHRLVLLALTAITLLTLDLRSFGPLDSAQRFVRDLLHPVTEVAGTAFSPLSDAWNAVFDYDDLEAENAELILELDQFRGDEIRAEAERQAFLRLLEATEITYLADVPFVAATVVRGAVGNFDSDVITIDKGSQKGIRSGMAVVTGAGLVGRIDRVDTTTATVQLISDNNLIVGVRLVDTDQVGLGQAVPGEDGLFEIDQGLDWPEDDDLSLLPAAGTAVVTAAASRYPAEIPVGWVIAAEQAADGLSLEVTVRLANDVDDLGFVSVLLTEGVDQVPLGDPVPATSVPLTVETQPPDGSAEDGDP
jgi:rod shape-determining protein MreC